MRNLIILTIAIAFFAQAYSVDLSKWHLKWFDEFDGNTLDKSKWEYEIWCQGGNSELQCYTDSSKNLKVADGHLTITAIQEKYTGSASKCTGISKFGSWVCALQKDYTSARIRTRGATDGNWKYGRFESRARLADGKHLWPALWLLPQTDAYGGWAASGEIDIMEAKGQKTNSISGAIHYGGSSPNNIHSGSGPRTFAGVDFSTSWHVFAVEWDEDSITWFVDDKVFHTESLDRYFYSGKGKNPYTKKNQPFDKNFFFLINLAIGGGFFGPEYGQLTTAQARQWKKPTLDVDYVRVYTKDPTPAPKPPSKATSKPAATSKTSSSASTSKPVTSKAMTSKPVTSKPATSKPAATSKTSNHAATSKTSNHAVTSKTSNHAVTSKTSAAPHPSTPVLGGTCGKTKCSATTSCCQDAKAGPTCFSSKSHVCTSDGGNQKHYLCPLGNSSCNGACFKTSQYKCANGVLKSL